MSDIAQAYAERGYDVGQRDAGVVLDVPNPNPYGADYFHGDNPHEVGFGSRGPEVEGIGEDVTVAPPATTTEAPTGEPDESWRNDDIRDYADQHDIHIPAGSNKAEMLDAIRDAE